jgi:hypothetical protein
MTTTYVPVRLCGASLRSYRHVCAFFHTREEEYRSFLPFIRDGIERGQRVVHVLDPEDHERHLGRLRDAGLDVERARGTHQLDVRDASDTYMPDGRFDKERMLGVIQDGLRLGLELGFPLTRLVAHAECVMADFPHANDWVEYEARLNYVLPRYRDVVICTYDTDKLGAAIAMDILRTHPLLIIGGLLQENPYYAPPDDFLRELDLRGRVVAPIGE